MNDKSTFIIIFRYESGVLGYVHEGNDCIATWETEDAAEKAANEIPICQACPYQIVELDI